MLVANDLPCGAVEPREAVKPGAAQYGVDGGASDAQPATRCGAVPRQAYGVQRRWLLPGAERSGGGCVGGGWNDRGARLPHLHGNRRTHFETVRAGDAEQAGNFGLGPASPSPVRPARARVTGVKRALRWGMRGLLLLLGFVHTTATARPLTCQQPLWELHLAGQREHSARPGNREAA